MIFAYILKGILIASLLFFLFGVIGSSKPEDRNFYFTASLITSVVAIVACKLL